MGSQVVIRGKAPCYYVEQLALQEVAGSPGCARK
jgi:hypothetical protein